MFRNHYDSRQIKLPKRLRRDTYFLSRMLAEIGNLIWRESLLYCSRFPREQVKENEVKNESDEMAAHHWHVGLRIIVA